MRGGKFSEERIIGILKQQGAGQRVAELAACSHNPVTSRNQRLSACERVAHIGCYNGCFVIDFILALRAALRALVRSRADLALEILAVRQQVAVLKRKVPRPPLKTHDRLFWIALCRLWPGWKNVLVIVKPDTVVDWHRTAFRW